jgi:hypothetical protein
MTVNELPMMSPDTHNKSHAEKFTMMQREGSVSFVHRPANLGYAMAQLVEVAGSIPDGVIGIFSLKSFRPPYSPGVDSASNRNEYQEYFLGVKAASACG